ncbi:McrC family protein [Clostridium estertheticum]|uniref:McrC family protein n=1 Tax=Clostridium estertheticum TaxID=238834 RepID=UPI001C0AB993|nr:McrC family protein [Clostridium estertheticum]MBU3176487.1 McrC family protein [Clostridium estertheticum]
MNQTVNLKEWDSIMLKDIELPDNDTRDIAKVLNNKGIIEIIELKDGLSISTNSYVGRIRLGELQINVYPKINGMPLYKLLRYAYGLRELKLFNEAEHDIGNFKFFDLLIYELYVEVQDLLHRGIQKSYVKRGENLSSPRGRIDINRLCGQGGITKDTLPCNYFNRDENNILNKTLLAGLKLGLNLVLETGLKIKLQRLCFSLEENISDIILTRARNSINRLTRRHSAVLEVINILYESQGIQLEGSSKRINLRGYFFDMNAFFEALIGRLLQNCSEGYSVKDQYSLHDMFIYTSGFNPCNRKSPTPRPDFALMKEGRVVKLLDAKYRDLWERSLPAKMLYQLAIYAVSGIGDKTATILYPTIADIPTTAKIDINDPVSSGKIASVILQPVNLERVSELVSGGLGELMGYVMKIIG